MSHYQPQHKRRIFLSSVILAIILIASFKMSAGESHSDQCHEIVLLGDSMTWIGGDSCQNDRGWTYHFKRMNPCVKIDMMARSGATWTNTKNTRGDTTFYSEVLHDENVIYNQVLRLEGRCRRDSFPKPDIILIYAGANDAWFDSRRPGIYGNGDTSLAVSIRKSLSILRNTLPETRVILITPAEMGKVPASKVTRVADLIESVGNAEGVEVWRADRDLPIRHASESGKLTYTSDGVHTNPEGARLIAEYISRNLNLK